MKVGIFRTKLVREAYSQYDAREFKSSKDAKKACLELFQPILKDCPQEQFWAVSLDVKNKIVGMHHVSTGIVNGTMAHPREVFQGAILNSAVSIILVHNHPSGSTEPSHEDIQTTRRMVAVGELIGIEVADHIIVAWDGNGNGEALSLRDNYSF